MPCRVCAQISKYGCRQMMAAHLMECHKVFDHYHVECVCGDVIYTNVDEVARLFAHFVECQNKRMKRFRHEYSPGCREY
jgi:hypothetical protein